MPSHDVSSGSSGEPDWRWTRAEALLAARLRAKATDGPLVATAMHFQAAMVRAQTAAEKRDLHRRWPDLSAAYQLCEAGGVVRDEIDARVLVNQSAEEIAALTGASADVIRIYEQLFWDVRSAVVGNAGDWLLGAVNLGSCTAGTVQERHVWQYAALSGGRHVLDVLIADHLGRREPVLEQRRKRAEGFRLCVRAYTLPWSPRSEAIAVLEAITPLWLEAIGNTAQTPEEWQLLRCELRLVRRSYGLVGLPRKPKPLGADVPEGEEQRPSKPKIAPVRSTARTADVEETAVSPVPPRGRTTRSPRRPRSASGRAAARAAKGAPPASFRPVMLERMICGLMGAMQRPDAAAAPPGGQPAGAVQHANEV